ncbi:hypothetical protein HN51_034243 [Arachis hypogaea]
MRDSSCMSCEETEPTSTKQSIDRNQYLAIQDACDKTSMLAYNVSLNGTFLIWEYRKFSCHSRS